MNIHSLPPCRGWIRALAASPDGDFLCYGGEDRAVQLYRFEGAAVSELGRHESWVTALAFLEGGRKLLSCSMDRHVCLWDVESARLLVRRRLPAPALCLAVLGSDTVWIGDDSGGLHRLSLPDLEPLHQCKLAVGGITDLSLSEDGVVLAAACGDEQVRLWDLQQNRPWERLKGHLSAVRTVCFLGQLLFSGGMDREIRVWNWKEGSSRAIGGHRGTVWQLRVAPGRGLLSASGDKSVALRQSDGSLEERVGEHRGEVRALAAGPEWVASGGQDAVVRVWPVGQRD